MEIEKLSREEMVMEQLPEVQRLMPFLPWLQEQVGQESFSTYSGNGLSETSMSVPVYDSKLMTFIKEVKKSKFIDKNYIYTYSRHRIKNIEDEKNFIKNAGIKDAQEIWNILAKYILKGATKGIYWSDGLKNGVYLNVLTRLKELIEANKVKI